MANELKQITSLIFTKGNVTASFGSANQFNRDVAGENVISNTQEIGSTAEAILLGDVSGNGMIGITNISATDVSLLTGSGEVEFGVLKPGDYFEWRRSTEVLKAKTASGTARVSYMAVSA